MANKAFSKLTGYACSKVNIDRLLPPNNDDWNAEKHGSTVQYSIPDCEGKSILAKITVSKIPLSETEQGLLYTFMDISEIARLANIKAQSELAHLTDELKRSNEELEQFAYVASHDLQEPLRMVNSYIQIIQKHINQGSYKDIGEFMKFVTDGASRMQALINDLLHYSRVNRKGSPFVTVNLNDVLTITLGHLSQKIKEHNALINYGPMPVLQGDTFQLIRLFQNLIDNAIKFQHPEKQAIITISVKEQVKSYLFEVKDNGIGIESKFHNRIFAIFQRLHTREEYEGTGIGLAVCKKIVERHGGEIWIESQPAEGSTFYFTIKK